MGENSLTLMKRGFDRPLGLERSESDMAARQLFLKRSNLNVLILINRLSRYHYVKRFALQGF